jgi:hypothetical protein
MSFKTPQISNILGSFQGGYLKTDPYLEQISIIKNNNLNITLKMKLTIGMSQKIIIIIIDTMWGKK